MATMLQHTARMGHAKTTTTTSVWWPFSRTTWLDWHQKGKLFWVLLEQEVIGWQWHQLDHMQIIYTWLRTDNHASTSPLSFYSLNALPAAQPTPSRHWRQHISCRNVCCNYVYWFMEDDADADMYRALLVVTWFLPVQSGAAFLRWIVPTFHILNWWWTTFADRFTCSHLQGCSDREAWESDTP